MMRVLDGRSTAARTGLGVVAVLVALTPGRSLAAQSVPEPTLEGVVRDALVGNPLSGARLRLVDLNRGTLTGGLGDFLFEGVPAGTYVLTVEQYGYEGIEAVVRVGAEAVTSVELELNPRPVMLEGVTVVADRIELMKERLSSRRKAVAVTTLAFEQERLLRSAANDVGEFLAFDAFVTPVPCGGGGIDWCIIRRGRAVEPTVYIDEAPVIGGLSQLMTYRPYDLYLVEVYSRGQEIRAYTHQFMERMARSPMHLIPIGVGRD